MRSSPAGPDSGIDTHIGVTSNVRTSHNSRADNVGPIAHTWRVAPPPSQEFRSVPIPLLLPARILVTGSSTVSWTSWMGGPRTDFALPRAIESALVAAGRPAEVRNGALLGTPTRNLVKDWETQVLQWSPDVIVIIAGHYETIHLFLPHWFERHANRADRLPGGLSKFYFRRIVRPLWKLLATVQSKVDGPLGARVLRRRLNGVATHLEAYFQLVQQVGSPMVYVLELLPPSGSKGRWFPGMTARIEYMNTRLRRLIDDYDHPNLRFVEVSQTASRLAGNRLEDVTPDGFHYSPALHRELGIELAKAIDVWAQGQQHLTPAPLSTRSDLLSASEQSTSA